MSPPPLCHSQGGDRGGDTKGMPRAGLGNIKEGLGSRPALCRCWLTDCPPVCLATVPEGASR
eukprot:4374846-Pyramimonas_sp.AAC.1